MRSSGTVCQRRGASCVGSRYLAAFTVFLLGLASLRGQYVVHSWAVAGGSGVSSGGDYWVAGSIGPSDAGAAITGGDYYIVGGYWPALATDPGPAPTLAIKLTTPGQLRISWTPDSPGWVLQERSSLSPSEWATIPTGTSNPMAIQVGDSTKFYRLMRSQ